MPVDPQAAVEITAFAWVPDFAQGFVRDLRPRWACEEIGLAYRERLIDADLFGQPTFIASNRGAKCPS